MGPGTKWQTTKGWPELWNCVEIIWRSAGLAFFGHHFFGLESFCILFQVYMTVDSGYSTWRGKLMEAMVGPYLQLHKLAMAEGKITRYGL